VKGDPKPSYVMDNDDQETENPGGGITNGANGANGQYQEQQVTLFIVYPRDFFKALRCESSIFVVRFFTRYGSSRTASGSDIKCWRNRSKISVLRYDTIRYDTVFGRWKKNKQRST